MKLDHKNGDRNLAFDSHNVFGTNKNCKKYWNLLCFLLVCNVIHFQFGLRIGLLN